MLGPPKLLIASNRLYQKTQRQWAQQPGIIKSAPLRAMGCRVVILHKLAVLQALSGDPQPT